MGEAVERFHEMHKMRFGYSRQSSPVELVNIRMEISLPRQKTPPPKVATRDGGDVWKRRDVLFKESQERIDTPVYLREQLPANFKSKGPAIIAERGSTTVVTPDSEFQIDSIGCIIIEVV
jgi:N-methylhydantoinase A